MKRIVFINFLFLAVSLNALELSVTNLTSDTINQNHKNNEKGILNWVKSNPKKAVFAIFSAAAILGLGSYGIYKLVSVKKENKEKLDKQNQSDLDLQKLQENKNKLISSEVIKIRNEINNKFASIYLPNQIEGILSEIDKWNNMGTDYTLLCLEDVVVKDLLFSTADMESIKGVTGFWVKDDNGASTRFMLNKNDLHTFSSVVLNSELENIILNSPEIKIIEMISQNKKDAEVVSRVMWSGLKNEISELLSQDTAFLKGVKRSLENYNRENATIEFTSKGGYNRLLAPVKRWNLLIDKVLDFKEKNNK